MGERYHKPILVLIEQHQRPPDLEDARFAVYEDEREVIATKVSTRGM